MTKVTIQTDCGHSPKRTFLKDFNIAFGTGNTSFLIDSVTDDVLWTIIGDKTIEGKEAFSEAIHNMANNKVTECVIENIVTHGKVGAVNGMMTIRNGKKYAFSDFYEFRNSKSTAIRTVTSYVIPI